MIFIGWLQSLGKVTMDRDFKFNSERYYDPTVYMALNNVQKGEKMEQIKAGEIWEYNHPNATVDSTGLVLAVNGDVVTFLKLIDTKNSKHDIEVNCRGIMYAGSSMIVYGFIQNFRTYIRTMNTEVFNDIKYKVAESLGISSMIHEVEVEKIVEVEKAVNVPATTSDVELERTKAQLEVYKGLYENLMQQMMGR